MSASELSTRKSPRRLTAWLIVLSTAMSASTMTGCASQGAPSEARAPIPASLTSPCQPLPNLQDGTGAAVLRWVTSASKAYHECAAKHHELAEAVK